MNIYFLYHTVYDTENRYSYFKFTSTTTLQFLLSVILKNSHIIINTPKSLCWWPYCHPFSGCTIVIPKFSDDYSTTHLTLPSSFHLQSLGKPNLWHITILNKRYPSNTSYSANLYRKPTKYDIWKEH